jgi:hypothetical protein
MLLGRELWVKELGAATVCEEVGYGLGSPFGAKLGPSLRKVVGEQLLAAQWVYHGAQGIMLKTVIRDGRGYSILDVSQYFSSRTIMVE